MALGRAHTTAKATGVAKL